MGVDFMYNISLDDKELTFKDLEKKIYTYACDEGGIRIFRLEAAKRKRQ